MERELETVGIRLNQDRPNVAFKVKTGGGITINATVKLTKTNEKMVQHILHDYSKYKFQWAQNGHGKPVYSTATNHSFHRNI